MPIEAKLIVCMPSVPGPSDFLATRCEFVGVGYDETFLISSIVPRDIYLVIYYTISSPNAYVQLTLWSLNNTILDTFRLDFNYEKQFVDDADYRQPYYMIFHVIRLCVFNCDAYEYVDINSLTTLKDKHGMSTHLIFFRSNFFVEMLCCVYIARSILCYIMLAFLCRRTLNLLAH